MKKDEYITKSAAIKAIGHAEAISPSHNKEFFESLRVRNAAIEVVEKIPPEDVAPVIHGNGFSMMIGGSLDVLIVMEQSET